MQLFSQIKRVLYFLSFFLSSLIISGQKNYSVKNGHAHNDYRYNQPFVQAHALGFGSIEVDVILLNDSLYVGHDLNEARKGLTFERGYIQPLNEVVERNKGFVYKDTSKKLQLLIDLKTESVTTMRAVLSVLNKFPDLSRNRSILFVITGNQPKADQFHLYPIYLYFDGNFSDTLHSTRELSRVGMFSANFKKYSDWKGDGKFKGDAKRTIKKLVRQAHKVRRPVRFWGAPDNPTVWREFIKLKVDYINTDRIAEFAAFVR